MMDATATAPCHCTTSAATAELIAISIALVRVGTAVQVGIPARTYLVVAGRAFACWPWIAMLISATCWCVSVVTLTLSTIVVSICLACRRSKRAEGPMPPVLLVVAVVARTAAADNVVCVRWANARASAPDHGVLAVALRRSLVPHGGQHKGDCYHVSGKRPVSVQQPTDHANLCE
jgi:hypothetical protein